MSCVSTIFGNIIIIKSIELKLIQPITLPVTKLLKSYNFTGLVANKRDFDVHPVAVGHIHQISKICGSNLVRVMSRFNNDCGFNVSRESDE